MQGDYSSSTNKIDSTLHCLLNPAVTERCLQNYRATSATVFNFDVSNIRINNIEHLILLTMQCLQVYRAIRATAFTTGGVETLTMHTPPRLSTVSG